MKWRLFGSRLARAEAPDAAAQRVLCDANLFLNIVSFQMGFPRDIVELARNNCGKLLSCMRLPELVVATGDLRLLQRLYRLYSDQSVVYCKMSFNGVWLDVLRAGNIAMAEWIDTHTQIHLHHIETYTLKAAITSQSVEMVQWLLQRRPQYVAHLSSEAMKDCPTVEMFQYLESTVKPLPNLNHLIDRAAQLGRVELVWYVVTRYTSISCSQNAIVLAAVMGHLEIVQLLHEYAHDQCSSDAMANAAYNGHLAIVQYLNEHCSAAHGSALHFAASEGRLEIVRYLVQTRTDVCLVRTHASVARSGKHRDVQDYLWAILNPAKQMPTHRQREHRDGSRRCTLL